MRATRDITGPTSRSRPSRSSRAASRTRRFSVTTCLARDRSSASSSRWQVGDVVDVPQRADTEPNGGRRHSATRSRVPGGGRRVRGTGVDDEHRHLAGARRRCWGSASPRGTGRVGEWERDVLVRQRPGVEQQRVAGPGKHHGHRVHDADRRADVVVLHPFAPRERPAAASQTSPARSSSAPSTEQTSEADDESPAPSGRSPSHVDGGAASAARPPRAAPRPRPRRRRPTSRGRGARSESRRTQGGPVSRDDVDTSRPSRRAVTSAVVPSWTAKGSTRAAGVVGVVAHRGSPARGPTTVQPPPRSRPIVADSPVVGHVARRKCPTTGESRIRA